MGDRIDREVGGDRARLDDALRRLRGFMQRRPGAPLLPRPLSLPCAVEGVIQPPADLAGDGETPCNKRAQRSWRFNYRVVGVAGYEEIRCARRRGHEGRHVVVLRPAFLRRNRVHAASWEREVP